MHLGLLKQNRMVRLNEGKGVWKKSTITFFNWSMVQEIYGDRASLLNGVSSVRPRTSAENIECVKQGFSRCLMKYIRIAARELELPLTTVHKVLYKRLQLYAYKVQMLQRLQPNNRPKRKEFAEDNEKKNEKITCCIEFLKMKDFLRTKNFSLHPALTLSP